MNGNQSQGGCELILTTDGQCITLILRSADGSENDGVMLDRDVWDVIVPIALSQDPVRLGLPAKSGPGVMLVQHAI